jgi:hypothetical protein
MYIMTKIITKTVNFHCFEKDKEDISFIYDKIRLVIKEHEL